MLRFICRIVVFLLDRAGLVGAAAFLVGVLPTRLTAIPANPTPMPPPDPPFTEAVFLPLSGEGEDSEG